MKILIPIIFAAVVYYGSVTKGPQEKGRIGIKFDPVGHTVVAVYKNSPADKVGLLPGDKILYVNDKDLIGPPDTLVNIIVQRGTNKIIFIIPRVAWSQVNTNYEKK